MERERGITVKAQTASIFYRYPNDSQVYLLNLIDTPGHVDFSYEVSRSMACCQGALLLVDSNQGIQAQTLANYYLALDANLSIIPVVTKIDQSNSRPQHVKQEMVDSLGVELEDIIALSAKTGVNCELIPSRIIEKLPKHPGDPSKPFRALLFDSWYDQIRGVFCMIQVMDGHIKAGDRIQSFHSCKPYVVGEVGIMFPEILNTGSLYTGQVGYIITGMRQSAEARVGDTFHREGERDKIQPLAGFKPAKPMVFAGIYPVDGEDFDRLKDSIDKLLLTDASVSISKESSLALGNGFRCGFLGLLHMDVFNQRLEQEFGTSVIITNPTVTFKIQFNDGRVTYVSNPNDFPSYDPKGDRTRSIAAVSSLMEPIVEATIIVPSEYLGAVITLCQEHRGEQLDMQYLDQTRLQLKYKMPLAEIIQDFYDSLKSISQGFASFDYDEKGFEPSDLVKIDILLNGKPVDAMASITHESKSYRTGRDTVQKLREVIPRQLFEVAIQASIRNKVIARET